MRALINFRYLGRSDRAVGPAFQVSVEVVDVVHHDLAVAVQGLGFLESGITDPLNHFSNTLLEFSALLRHTVSLIDPS